MSGIELPPGWAAVLIDPDGRLVQALLPQADGPANAIASEACHIAAGLLAATQDEIEAVAIGALKRLMEPTSATQN